MMYSVFFILSGLLAGMHCGRPDLGSGTHAKGNSRLPTNGGSIFVTDGTSVLPDVPHCTQQKGGKCTACQDLSGIGGMKYLLIDGLCVAVLGADDISGDGYDYDKLPRGFATYGGLEWVNMYYAINAHGGGGNDALSRGMVSRPGVMFNGYGKPGIVMAPGPKSTFCLQSVWVTSATSSDQFINFYAFTDEVNVKVKQSGLISTKKPTLVTFTAEEGFCGMTQLKIVPSEGMIVMDDFHVY